MGFFNKKPTTIDELSKAIAALSEEDKKKLYAQAFGEVDDKPSEDETVETPVEETTDGEPVTTEATKETSEGNDNDAQTETEAEAPVETVAQEATEEEANAAAEEVTQNTEERHEEIFAALVARMDSMEQRFERFEEILSDFADLQNDDGPLGASAQPDIGNGDDMSEDERIMSAYNPNWRRG